MDETLGKSERLCLNRRFEALITGGQSFFIYPFRVIYLENQLLSSDPLVQIGFTVKKKQFKRAVVRNLIKRRTRESWRKRKGSLYGLLREQNINLLILLVYGAETPLPYEEIDRKIGQVIKRLETEFSPVG